MPKGRLIDIVCCNSGSNRIVRDARAKWDVRLQDWVLNNVFDGDSECMACEAKGDCAIEKEIQEDVYLALCKDDKTTQPQAAPEEK